MSFHLRAVEKEGRFQAGRVVTDLSLRKISLVNYREGTKEG